MSVTITARLTEVKPGIRIITEMSGSPPLAFPPLMGCTM